MTAANLTPGQRKLVKELSEGHYLKEPDRTGRRHRLMVGIAGISGRKVRTVRQSTVDALHDAALLEWRRPNAWVLREGGAS